jgi:hypothetical protein
MFVNVAKRSIYSDPKKSAHASLHKAYREAFMIYLFERETLMNVTFSNQKLQYSI